MVSLNWVVNAAALMLSPPYYGFGSCFRAFSDTYERCPFHGGANISRLANFGAVMELGLAILLFGLPSVPGG